MAWDNDLKGAEEEFRKAIKLDPSDASPHVGLGDIRVKEKNLDAALEEYRIAEGVDPNDPDAFKSAGKLLLDKKDFAGAAAELKKAEAIGQSSWEIHELYAKALAGSGQGDLAIGEFKEAVALDPNQGQVMSEIAVELEKKGDWLGALEQYRKGAAADENRLSKVQPGESAWHYDPSPRKQYTEAKARLADHLVALRTAGKKDEAADLEKRVAMMDASSGTLQKVQEAMQAGDGAMRERRSEEALKAFQEAVTLAENLPPGDENMAGTGSSDLVAQRFQPLGAGLAVVALWLPPGPFAGVLASGWMTVCGLMGVSGVIDLVAATQEKILGHEKSKSPP